MALMLCLLQNMMSSIMSCLVMARPRFASNSWRSAPLKTTRLPLSFMMPSSMRNVRKPIRCTIFSTSGPSWPTTSTVSSYRVGSSALHGAMFFSAPELRVMVSLAHCVDSHTTVPFASRSFALTVAASFALRNCRVAFSVPAAMEGL